MAVATEQVNVVIKADTTRFYNELNKLSSAVKKLEKVDVSFNSATSQMTALTAAINKANGNLAKTNGLAESLASSLEAANIAGDNVDANPSRLATAATAAQQIAGSLEAANIAGDQIDANAGRLEAAASASGLLVANLGAANVAGDGIGTKVGDATKKVGLLAAGASVAGTALAGVLGFKAVQSASDLNEALNKNTVVFGEQAAEIEAWARQMKTMGISTTDALDASASFGNLFESFDVPKSQKEIADMSKTLTELSADIGSFMNVDAGGVMAAFRSGLSGETEPLKRFGIIATDTALRNTELAKSMNLPPGPLDQATKSLLIYQQILDSTKNAQGDYLRTSNSFPNLGKAIKATFTDSFAELGNKILPALAPVLQGFINKIDPLVQSFAPVLESLAPLAGVFAEQLTGLIGAIAPVFATFITALTPVLSTVGTELVKMVSELAPVFEDLLYAVSPLVVVFTQMFSSIATPLLKVFLQALTPIALVLRNVIVAAQPFIEMLGKSLATAIEKIIPIFEAFIMPIIDAIIPTLEIVAPLFEELFNTIIDLLPSLTPIFEQLGGIIAEVMIQLALATADILPLFIDLFRQLIPALLPLLPAFLKLAEAFIPLIPPILQLSNMVLPLLITALVALTPVIEKVVTFLSLMFTWVGEKLAPVIQDFVDKHGDDIKNLFDNVSGAVETVVNWLGALWNKFEEIAPKIGEFILSVVSTVSGFGETVWNALSGGFNFIKNNIGNWVNGVGDLFKSIGTSIIDGVLGALRTLRTGFNSIIKGFNAVTGFVGIGPIDEIPQFHTGGVIGAGGKMRPMVKQRADEQLIMALKGEGVLPQHAMDTWGHDVFELMRAGDRPGLMRALLSNGVSKRDTLSADYDKIFSTARQGDGIGGFLKGIVSDVLGAFGIEIPDISSLFGDSIGTLFDVARKYLAKFVEKFKNLLTGGGKDDIKALGQRSSIAAAAGKPGSWHSLVAYLEALGVPHVVTSTFRPFAITASGNRSYHAQNRAVDLAPPGGGVDNAGLGRIFWAFKPVFDLLAELIYAGPQTDFNIKNGAKVGKYAQAIHHNHVHAAAEHGGIVRGTARGKLILAGERNKDEAILPLNDRPRTRQILESVGMNSGSVTVEGSTFTFNNQASPGHVASIIKDYFDTRYVGLGF